MLSCATNACSKEICLELQIYIWTHIGRSFVSMTFSEYTHCSSISPYKSWRFEFHKKNELHICFKLEVRRFKINKEKRKKCLKIEPFIKKGEKFFFFWPESPILTWTRDILLQRGNITAKCPKEHEYQTWGWEGSCKELTELVQGKCYVYRKIY